MSAWRAEASKQLPELQALIASPSLETPSDLWIELYLKFDDLCRTEPVPVNLLSRIWQYAIWCSERKDESVELAAVNHFFECIQDTRRYREILPQFMTLEKYQSLFQTPGPNKKKQN